MLAGDFETLSRLVKSESGLAVSADKAYLFEARLRPIAQKWKLNGIEQLAEALRCQRNAAQIRDVIEAMTVNESFFFRDAKPFDQLRQCLLPNLMTSRGSARRLRIWSSAASSGQEAYSIAMLIDELGLVAQGWTVEVVGSDISTEILERAKAGLYTSFEVQRGLPAKLLARYFTRDGDKWRVAEPLRRAVRFTRHNLLHDLAPLGQFDIIFCRNVLLYFDVSTKARVLAAIHRQMPADGYLVLGAAETVLGVSDKFTSAPGLPGVFVPLTRHSGAAAARLAALAQEPRPLFQYGSSLS